MSPGAHVSAECNCIDLCG